MIGAAERDGLITPGKVRTSLRTVPFPADLLTVRLVPCIVRRTFPIVPRT
jgi:hypothetical protein